VLISTRAHIADWASSPFADVNGQPWEITSDAAALIREALTKLCTGYCIADDIAIHDSAQVEAGAIIKPPAILGPKCFIASHSYLRGGVFLGASCSVGPGCEVKSSFIFSGSAIAHFNYIGDSIVGGDCNVEAGAVVANSRNEDIDKQIRVKWDNELIETGMLKFGALIGDGCKIGANAVLAPGTVLQSNTVVPRLALVDQLSQR
jgi:NDP-sugar pyrophosphorylase family protein